MKRLFGLILVVLTVAVVTRAGTCDSVPEIKPLRPVMSAYMVEGDGSHLADTYLTPLKYDGWGVALRYERMQAMKFNPDRWVMRLTAGIEADHTENPARNATMWYWGLDLSWGMMHRWSLPHGLTVAGGGSTSLDLGCLYNSRNGNNPASAKAAWTVNVTGYVSWNLNLWWLPVTLRYQPTIPVTGVFFAPDYGELYYEIYLGNHSGLAHAAWWGNYFMVENLLTADLHFGNTSLRVGYRGRILSTQVNDITTRMITNNFVLGVSGEWISVSPRKGIDPRAGIVSALY